MTHKNPKKVTITVSDYNYFGERCKYHKEIHNGKEYTSVRYGASEYGAGSPCDNKEEIENSIKHAKENILRHGDIPVLNDERVKRTLMDFF